MRVTKWGRCFLTLSWRYMFSPCFKHTPQVFETVHVYLANIQIPGFLEKEILQKIIFSMFILLYRSYYYIITTLCLIIMTFMMFLNVFHFLSWHTTNDNMNKHWIFWKIFFKIYRKDSSYSKSNKWNNSFYKKLSRYF